MLTTSTSHMDDGKRILIIEDNEDVASLLEHVLAAEGHLPEVARDGGQALAALAGEPPALALLDLMMPIYNGFEILRRIRETPGWEQVPVIVLTSRSRPDDIEKAHRLGAADYLLKPFEPRTLVRHINDLLGKRSDA